MQPIVLFFHQQQLFHPGSIFINSIDWMSMSRIFFQVFFFQENDNIGKVFVKIEKDV